MRDQKNISHKPMAIIFSWPDPDKAKQYVKRYWNADKKRGKECVINGRWLQAFSNDDTTELTRKTITEFRDQLGWHGPIIPVMDKKTGTVQIGYRTFRGEAPISVEVALETLHAVIAELRA